MTDSIDLDRDFFYGEFRNIIDSFYSLYRQTRVNYSAYLSPNVESIWNNLLDITNDVETRRGYYLFNSIKPNNDLYFVANKIYKRDTWITFRSCLEFSKLCRKTFDILDVLVDQGYANSTQTIKSSILQIDSLNNPGVRYITSNPDDLISKNPSSWGIGCDFDTISIRILGYDRGVEIAAVF